jgi:hypothetical protein
MTETIVRLALGVRGTGKSHVVKNYLIGEHKRCIIYDTQGEYTQGVVFEDFESLKKFWANNFDKNFRIIYRPLNHSKFSELCELVYLCGKLLFVVEELDLVAGTYDDDINFQSVLKRGRHQEISFVGISQRPFGINRNITSQAKEVYSFRQIEPRDIDYLKYYLGEGAELIQELKKYHFFYWNYSVEGYKILTLKGKDLVDVTDEYKKVENKLDNSK